MQDTIDSNVTATVVYEFEVINGACIPALEVSKIEFESSYSYTIDGEEMLITNVTDFTCGSCKPVVEIRIESPDEEDLYNVETEFIRVVEIGRVYRNIDGWPNRWRI